MFFSFFRQFVKSLLTCFGKVHLITFDFRLHGRDFPLQFFDLLALLSVFDDQLARLVIGGNEGMTHSLLPGHTTLRVVGSVLSRKLGFKGPSDEVLGVGANDRLHR